MTTYQEHAEHICAVLGVDQETARLSGLATYLECYVVGPIVATVGQVLKDLGESPNATGILAAVLRLNRILRTAPSSAARMEGPRKSLRRMDGGSSPN